MLAAPLKKLHKIFHHLWLVESRSSVNPLILSWLGVFFVRFQLLLGHSTTSYFRVRLGLPDAIEAWRLQKDSGAQAMSEQPGVEATEEEHHASAHDEALVEEWEDESFPASDPPSNY